MKMREFENLKMKEFENESPKVESTFIKTK